MISFESYGENITKYVRFIFLYSFIEVFADLSTFAIKIQVHKI